ncbi:hypothetical protein C2U55_04900 [Enterobacteriaceae bacterium ENNIH3]|nr:hypothetical protein C2U55_04900 [Enterobacteriaceae bacterium ENNIH3]AUV06226.1 hypothetical protein C2U52_08065 [Enterobacteriaceae bacterium ENNIH2]PWF52881.1 hypothetical protein BHT19_0019065 [[Kluyvera] intestini]
MFAVVPCQWRRIIGSSCEVTSINFKKVFNRLFFQQDAVKSTVKGLFCCFCHHRNSPGGILKSE